MTAFLHQKRFSAKGPPASIRRGDTPSWPVRFGHTGEALSPQGNAPGLLADVDGGDPLVGGEIDHVDGARLSAHALG